MDHPDQSGNVVGSSRREDVVVSVYNNYNLARSYDSFSDSSPPQAFDSIGDWHSKQDTNGITSMLLLSDASTSYDPAFIQSQLIDFHNQRPKKKYDAVMIGLEPQSMVAWNASDLSLAAAINRRDMLWDLQQTIVDIRTQLDGNGERKTDLFASIPSYFDVLDGFIGWGEGVGHSDEQERDSWFSALDNELNGITFLAYGIGDVTTIKAEVDWEINNYPGDVRVGVEASIGSGNLWPDTETFFAGINEIEDFYAGTGHTIGVDISTFTEFFVAVQPEPTTSVLSLMGLGALSRNLGRRWNN